MYQTSANQSEPDKWHAMTIFDIADFSFFNKKVKKKKFKSIFTYTCLLSIILTSCAVIPPYESYIHLSEKKQKEFKLEPLDTNNQSGNKILSINSDNLLSVITKDTTCYKILVFFTFWCPSSEEYLPIFIEKTKNTKVKIFYISPDDWVYKPQYMEYKSKLHINANFYLLDAYQYGKKRNPHYRMGKFISEICSNCQNIKGFPSFMVFNGKNEIIYKNVGSISDKVIEEIKNNDL